MIEDICKFLYKKTHPEITAKVCNFLIEEGKEESSIIAGDIKDILQAHLFLLGDIIECAERHNEIVIEHSSQKEDDDKK